MRHLDKLFSLRLWVLCGLAAALIGAIASELWEPLGWPVFVIAFIGIFGAQLLGPSVAVCPHCRKRVKLGASTCHHCGQRVA